MKHPNLARKLQLLYSLQLNPSIKTNSDLARVLEVSRQAVSRWCRGTASSYGDCIPHYQVAPIAQLFRIEISWFSLPFEDFETNVRERIVNNAESYLQHEPEVSNSTMPITSLELFGRESEIELLNSYWQREDVNVVQLIAFGGVGKSSLVNRWLTDLKQSDYKDAKRVYAWSFYWQGESSELKSSGDLFIEHALEWCGDENPAMGTPWAKASRLAKLIRASKTLLVLDGLEPLQLGPGARQGQIENPAIACLVRELAEKNTGLCLITSRLAVRDLENYVDGRVETIDLDHLSKTASINYLKSLGIFGESKHFETVSEHYQGHALSLSLLGGYLSVVHEGEISFFQSIDSLFGESILDSHAKNVLSAYLNYYEDSDSLNILFLLSLLDRAIDLEEFKIICNFSNIPGVTHELNIMTSVQWLICIKQLEASRLISVKRIRNKIVCDCHPIVRDFTVDHFRKKYEFEWVLSNNLFFDYYTSISSINPSNMQELEPFFRAVIFGVNAGRAQEAFEIYYEKIKRKQFSMSTEGSHYADQACIKAFFKNQWNTPLECLSNEAKVYLLSSAAANLIYLGDIYNAIEPSLSSINMYIKNEQYFEAACAAGPLMSMLIMAGEIGKAKNLEDSLKPIIESSNNEGIIGVASNFSGYVDFLIGDKESAAENFRKSEKVLSASAPNSSAPFPTISAYYCKFLLETGKVNAALNRALKTFGWRRNNSWQVAIDTTSLLASDIIVLGLIFLQFGDKPNAKKHLDRQIELLKFSDEWLYLPTGLCARAKFNIAINNFSDALNDLDEAIEISQKTGAKFGEWEAYLEMSQLFLKQKKYEESHEYLSKALALPNMDMYRFRDTEIGELQDLLAKHLPQADIGKSVQGEHLH